MDATAEGLQEEPDMTILSALSIFNYALVLIYGLFLSTSIAGGWETKRQMWTIIALCPAFLLIQSIFWLNFGAGVTKELYPLIVHLPLVLALVFVLKKPVGVALVSTCTAYLCCQLPRWVNIMTAMLTRSDLLGEVLYTLTIVPMFFLLQRYFVKAAYDAMTCSQNALLLFGSLPVAYYLFDYATTIYSQALYAGIQALNEFLPTVLIVFYVIFLAAYHTQNQQRTEAELQNTMLEEKLKRSGVEMAALRRSETQTAVYKHDMRHHLNMINSFLSAEKPLMAAAYIRKVQSDIEAITPKRYCENETVNLLCSSFEEKARHLGVELQVDARLPRLLSISETELCSVLSNALENALRAAAEAPEKWVTLYCEVRGNKLLIEVKNPYRGKVTMVDELPVSGREGHGYGCRSIRSIAQNRGGLCAFQAENGIFLMRLVLPDNSSNK